MILSQEATQLWRQARELIVQSQYQQACALLKPLQTQTRSLELAIDIISLLIKCQDFNTAQQLIIFWKEQYPAEHRLYGLEAQLCYAQAQYQQARKLYQELLVSAPLELKYWVNLAYSCAACQDLPAALKAFEKSSTLMTTPDPRWYYNYGMALLLEKQPRAALEKFEKCYDAYKNDAEYCFHYALALELSGDDEQALQQYHRNVLLWPQELRHCHNAAILHYRRGDKEQALQYLRQVLTIQPDHPMAHPLYCALSDQHISALPSLFSKLLFDQYAFNYDSHLKERLQYQAPSLIRQFLGQACSHLDAGVVYDLGCGTGLLAPFIADLTTTLIGIDTSEGMLAQARQKGFYQHLIQAHLPQELALFHHIPDYVFALELSNYLGGDLELLIEKVADLIAINGIFALTIETHQHQQPYHFHEQARYSYQIDWVKRCAEKSCWQLLFIQQAPLRLEKDIFVPGAYIILQKK